MQNTNEMMVVSLAKKNIQVILGVGLVAVVACAGAHYGLRYRAMTVAERLVGKGYGLLAQETLEPFKKELASTERGCKLMLNTYFQTQDARNLEYAAQSCLNHDRDIPEVYLGLASAREFAGKDSEAIQVLSQVFKKFDKVAEIPLKIAQILQRNKRDKEAVSVYALASDRAPQDYRLALDVLQYALQAQSPTEVKSMAERLKTAPTDNAEVKFLLAKAFHQVGDAASSKTAVDQAKDLMNKTPATKPELEKKYADLLNPETVASNTSEKTSPKHKRVPSNSKVD